MRLINHKNTKGFTVIEILVVAPIIVLVVGTIIGVIIYMTGDVLSTRAANVLTYNVQDAMERIEEDTERSGAYLSANNFPVVSPQGVNDDDTEFVNASAEGDALILNMYATTDNPSVASSDFIYTKDQPNSCDSESIDENGRLMVNVVYFVKDDTLWRRVLVPADYSSLGCEIPWQVPSCSPDESASICESNDIRLVDGVTEFDVNYYSSAASSEPNAVAGDPGSTNSERAQALEDTATVRVNIEAGEAVAGRTVQSSAGSIAISPNNETSNALPNYSAPVVAAHPQEGAYEDGDTASFSASAEGYPAPSVQWQISQNQGGSWSNVSGANSFSLDLGAVSKSQDGDLYRAVVSNTEGSDTSSVAMLKVGDAEWQPMNLQNGWETHSTTYSSPEYRITAGGVVVLKGLVKKSGTPSASEVIANLPAGYRPTDRLMFVTNSSSSDHGRIDVDSNGNVDFYYGTGGWISLEGIRFIPAGSQYERTNVTSFQNGWSNYGGSTWPPLSYVMDGMGRVHTQGLLSVGTEGNNTAIASLPNNYLSSSTLIFPQKSYGSSWFGEIRLRSSGIAAGGTDFSSYSSAQMMFYPSTYSAWTDASLQNNWVNYGNEYGDARYTKSQDGLVTLSGLIRSGTTSNYTVLFNLPEGYRPARRLLTIVSTANNPGRVDIRPNGDASVKGVSSSWVSLDGISFYADQ